MGVYVLEVIMDYCREQMLVLPIFDFNKLNSLDVDANGDNWKFLLNPFTMEYVQQAKVLIDIFYLGYGKNKFKDTSSNHDFQVVRKIFDYELLKDEEKVIDGTYSQTKKLDPNIEPTAHE